MEKTLTRLRSVDASSWTEEDRTTLRTVLIDLKAQIETWLTAA